MNFVRDPAEVPRRTVGGLRIARHEVRQDHVVILQGHRDGPLVDEGSVREVERSRCQARDIDRAIDFSCSGKCVRGSRHSRWVVVPWRREADRISHSPDVRPVFSLAVDVCWGRDGGWCSASTGSVGGDAPGYQPGEGGSTPTSVLHIQPLRRDVHESS